MLRLIEGAAATIESHAEQLTRLDQAIGDGDHGINMARGFKEVAAQKEAIAALPLGDGLKRLGMTLVMKVGGASGPLYGTLFIDMGKAAPLGRRAFSTSRPCSMPALPASRRAASRSPA